MAFEQGMTSSGVYDLWPRGHHNSEGVMVRAYCDMTQTPPGQSLFDLPTGSLAFVGSKVCSLTWSNDDNDNTMMWVDYTGRQRRDNGHTTYYNDWFVTPRDSWLGTGSSSMYRYIWGGTSQSGSQYLPSAQTGSWNHYEKPVPFPGSGMPNGTVVWFGQNSLYFRAGGADVEINYPSQMSNCKPQHTSSDNVNLFITDGINRVTIGKRSGNLQCLTVLTFDWTAETYDFNMLTATTTQTSNFQNPANWHNTEEDFMGGDLLWTVQGKPCWYSSNYLRLGTSMENPFQSTASGSVSAPSGGNFNTQHGIDFFFKVDEQNNLWAGDWGHDNGGMFGCGGDNQLGAMMTTIKLL